jgi:hypothetical protein
MWRKFMRHSISGRLRHLVERVKSLVGSENKAAAPVRRRGLHLEELSARVLPSANPLVAVHGHVAHAAHHMEQQPPLDGKGQGTFTDNPIPRDAGITYTLGGTATFAGLGDVTVSGTVHSVGFIREGNATGELTFKNANGSVTVKLTGPTQPGISALPHKFEYTVTGGTGQYKNLSGDGTLHLVLTATARNLRTGTFTLKA